MRNIFSINKTKTLIVGKIASVAALSAFAMIFAAPSLANPSMCGLPNVKATFKQAIVGFSMNADGTYTFIPAPPGTPLMLGSYVEIVTPKGDLPGTIRSISGSATKPTVKGFVNPHVLADGATVTIAGATKLDSTALKTSESVTMVQPIVSFTLKNGTFTFVAAPKDTPIMPGSWIEVTTADGKTLPATIESKMIPDKNDPTKLNTTGYVEALDKTQAAKVTISLTTAQSAGSW
jgi:hypothetical protein